MNTHFKPFAVALVAAIGTFKAALAADWPTWRHDAARGAATPAALPTNLHLQWVRQLPPPHPAWPRQQDDGDKLQFDLSYSPVVSGKTLFIASMAEDCLIAFDTATGAERWRFFGEGPMRLAPACWGQQVYAVSDDGYLYCLDIQSGKLLWKFRGAPGDRKVLGNGRLISMWPARGGPVIMDGKVYFTAGLWPFMGIFVYALDAMTGKPLWVNSNLGSVFVPQQHNAPSFAGVAPQGYLTATSDYLLIPGGRTPPVCLDRSTGALRHLNFASRFFDKSAGGYAAPAQGALFFNGNGMYFLDDGKPVMPIRPSVLTDVAMIALDTNGLIAYLSTIGRRDVTKLDPRGLTIQTNEYFLSPLWQMSVGTNFAALHLQAGSRLFCSEKGGNIVAIEISREGQAAAVTGRYRIEGDAWEMIAADDRLFVSTRQGALYCFGEQKVKPQTYRAATPRRPFIDARRRLANAFIKKSGATGGYCYVLGSDAGRLAEGFALQGQMQHVVVIEPRVEAAEALRRRFAGAGFYGGRIAVSTGPLESLPPYLAELIVADDVSLSQPGFIESIYRLLRPYGGAACLTLDDVGHAELAARLNGSALANAKLRRMAGSSILVRAGAIPGTADWTHQNADIGNTVSAPDSVVKAPLGPLWFGGPSNAKVLPRHGHGPSPQVAGGRLFILGPDSLSARDVYTGRSLWEADLPGIGKAYDSTLHQPGANTLSANFVSTTDSVYVLTGSACLRLDAADGRLRQKFRLSVGESEPVPHGYIGAWEDLLILTVKPRIFDGSPPGATNWNAAASECLVVKNRFDGKTLWTRDAVSGFRHTAIVAGNGKLFCIDMLPQAIRAKAARHGEATNEFAVLMALDLRTGAEKWRAAEPVFGSWLGYSAEHDILIQAGRHSTDMMPGESRDRITAYRGRDGNMLWDKQEIYYEGPLILLGERIISSSRRGWMFDIFNGDIVKRRHPLTDREEFWSYSRQHGCGTVLAGVNLLTFRSGAAGYFNLAADGGTGNFGGFKSGCTVNLLPAGGVLNAPDYTRTCTCSYQLQSSLALVNMPEVEEWTWSTLKYDPARDGRVRRVGINLGAPGDRQAEDGTLWLDYPSAGGPSPDIPLTVSPTNVVWFHMHSALMTGGPVPWVGASGFEGEASMVLSLNNPGAAAATNSAGEAKYSIRLVFSEPVDLNPGERLFDVALQGRKIMERFDVVREASASRRSLIREFKDIVIRDALKIDLLRSPGSVNPPILSGVEALAAEAINR